MRSCAPMRLEPFTLTGTHVQLVPLTHAHVEGLEAASGDLVQIEECAPFSKTKAWRVAKVVEKARIV